MTTLINIVFIKSSNLFEHLFGFFLPTGDLFRLVPLLRIDTISYITKILNLGLRLTVNMIESQKLLKIFLVFTCIPVIKRSVTLLVFTCIPVIVKSVALLIFIISFTFIIDVFTPQELISLSCIPLIGVKGYCSNSQAGLGSRAYSIKRLTNSERNSFTISPELDEVMIGLCLGDLGVRKHRRGVNAILQFEQGVINEGYLLHLYDLFKAYCGTGPKILTRKPNKVTGKIYQIIRFATYSLPCLNYYYGLFYVDSVKRIPLNIGELLTPIGLAYWCMDDGYLQTSGNSFNICTDSYTLNEVELLIKVLKQNFDLDCTYQRKRKNQYRIYIKAGSMDKFRSLVTPYFHESMMYKLTVKGLEQEIIK